MIAEVCFRRGCFEEEAVELQDAESASSWVQVLVSCSTLQSPFRLADYQHPAAERASLDVVDALVIAMASCGR